MIPKNIFNHKAYKREIGEAFSHSSIYRFVSAALIGIFKTHSYADTKREFKRRTAGNCLA